MIKNTTTEAIRTTCRKITAFINKGKQSVRAIGRAIDRPKSTLHRHLRSLDSRNQHPESYFWETEEGDAWLRRLVLAVIFFGSLLILVLMDLSSGYLLLESIADDRSFDTWFVDANPRFLSGFTVIVHSQKCPVLSW